MAVCESKGARTSVLAILMLFFSYFFLPGAQAAAPLPPCLEPPCEPASVGLYDLSQYDIPFEIQWPTLPEISSDVVVTPGNFNANNTDGNRLLLSPGRYGNITLSGADREIVLTDGVFIGRITIASNSYRLRITADPQRSGRIESIHANPASNINDLTIDGVTLIGTSTNNMNVLNGLHRHALVNSSITMPAYTSFIRSDPQASEDIIIANNELITAGDSANVRHHNVERSVVVGNRIVSQGRHTYRIHAPYAGGFTDLVYVAENQLERGGIQAHGATNGRNGFVPGGFGIIDRIWFENNRLYYNGNSGSFQPGYQLNGFDSRVVRLTMRSNRLATTGDPWIEGGDYPLPPNWSIEGDNEVRAYEAPPAWSFQ